MSRSVVSTPFWPILARRCRDVLAASLLFAAGVLPATEGASAASPDPQARIVPSENLTLEIRAGRIIRLERPAAAVFVADPDVADVQAHSPTLVYVFGKKTGATTIYAIDQDEQVIFERTVEVTHPLARLQEAIDRVLPDQSVKAESIDHAIILTGEVSDPAMARDAEEVAQTYVGDKERVINRIVVQASTQVNLRVRVAEVSRDANEIFGVNLDAAVSTGDTFFNLVSGRGFLAADRSTFSRFVDQSGSAGGLLGGVANDTLAVDGMIDALEREGLVVVLAEPNLTAISGETASFLAGGEFPVPVGRDGTDLQIEFKEFGVRLAFTPTVLSSSRISLKVRPEVSDLDFANAIVLSDTQVPALKTRKAETTIELGSGQSFAIGGLISSTTQNNLEKLPGLGDVPILGALFRSTSFQRSQSELVIIVTPYLVRPTRPSALQTPADGYRPPSKLERILEGRLTKPTIASGVGAIGASGGLRLAGPAGFDID